MPWQILVPSRGPRNPAKTSPCFRMRAEAYAQVVSRREQMAMAQTGSTAAQGSGPEGAELLTPANGRWRLGPSHSYFSSPEFFANLWRIALAYSALLRVRHCIHGALPLELSAGLTCARLRFRGAFTVQLIR